MLVETDDVSGLAVSIEPTWEGAMADIFISYARPDRAMAEGLAKDLTAQGYSVWWDAELVGSDDFYQVILEALQQAKAAIVIWTKESVKSRFVRDEARFALHLNKLVAAKAPGLDVYDIPFGFQGQHTEDVLERDKIVRACQKLGARPAARPQGAAQTAPLKGWERIAATATIDSIVEFLGTNPPDADRLAALTRLKQLAADQQEASKANSSTIRALTASNWQAFLSGLVLKVPKFQLTAQGTWTSIGAALAYSLIALAVTIGIVIGLRGLSAALIPRLFINFAVSSTLAALAWGRMEAFLKQRNSAAGIILSITFVLLAWFATFEVLPIFMPIFITVNFFDWAAIGAFLPYIILVIWRIRAYR